MLTDAFMLLLLIVDSMQQSILDARTAAVSAAEERKTFLRSQKHVKFVEEDVTDVWKAANMSSRGL